MRTAILWGLLIFGRVFVAAPCHADVVSEESYGFQIKIERRVEAAPADVYKALTEEIGQWWSDSHTFSGDASNLSLEARPGGALLERLPNGGFVRHLEVIHVAPSSRLVLRGGLGPLQDQGVAAAMTWQLEPLDNGGCRIQLTYNVAGFIPAGLDKLAKPVDGVLDEQVANLVEHLRQ